MTSPYSNKLQDDCRKQEKSEIDETLLFKKTQPWQEFGFLQSSGLLTLLVPNGRHEMVGGGHLHPKFRNAQELAYLERLDATQLQASNRGQEMAIQQQQQQQQQQKAGSYVNVEQDLITEQSK